MEAISKGSFRVGDTSKRLKLSLDAKQKSCPAVASSNSENIISFVAIHPASAIPPGLSFDRFLFIFS